MLNPSVRAILARCGSKTKAMHYCVDVAHDYPQLRHEYNEYLEILLNMKG